MSTPKIARVWIFVISIVFSVILAEDSYVIPQVRIQAFRPKGVRISIPDVPGITLFCFNGNINKDITAAMEYGQIRAEVKAPTNGRWIFIDPNVQLNIGDVIHYYVILETGLFKGTMFVSGHYSGTLRHKIERLEDNPSVLPMEGGCNPSLTKVYERIERVCSGQVLFEDRFTTIDKNVWQIEHTIPDDHPEYPFLSYQRSAVTIEDKYLNIKVKLQENEPGFSNATIYSGTLNLFDGCTRPQCSKTASGPDIVPPAVSGRLTSKGFAFKYGSVHIRAKLPVGDWLYPELMLEPVSKKYGIMNYASGVLKIAAARGNENLAAGSKEYGNKVLYGGPIMSLNCREQLLKIFVQTENRPWGDDFHTYSIRWTPDYISLSVDGQEWGYIEPGKNRLRGQFARECNAKIPANDTKMAPFDDFFYITLGVSVGGTSEFRDEVKTKSDCPKPWKNSSRKAMLNFWRDLNSWFPTWKRPRLIVDYVRVIAL